MSGTYEFLVKTGPPPCTAALGKALGYPIRITVASKGEIYVAVAEGPCVDSESIRTQTQTFTVTGGTGSHAGASGSGSLARALGQDIFGQDIVGKETWTGPLTVAGLEFDLTAPTFTGATNKTVRAKKARRRLASSSRSRRRTIGTEPVPVTCDPKSGTRSRLGRTRVTCRANDTSANTATATFTVTIKKR